MPEQPDRLAGMRYVAVGIEFGTTIAAAVVLGYYLDEYLGTAPWLTLLLAVGGLFGGLQRLIWSLKRHSSR